MAAQTAVMCQHATLSGTTADTVVLSGDPEYIEIINRDPTVMLYFTVAYGVAATTAVSAADETDVVLPYGSVVIPASTQVGDANLSIVGNGNPYSVVGRGE